MMAWEKMCMHVCMVGAVEKVNGSGVKISTHYLLTVPPTISE